MKFDKLFGRLFSRFVISFWGFNDHAHSNGLYRYLDPADLAIDDSTDLLDIGFEFSFGNACNVSAYTAQMFSLTASGYGFA
jgi:hypothetical protein